MSNILFLKLKTCDSLHGCLGGIKINILISMLVIPFFLFNLEKKKYRDYFDIVPKY